VTATPAAALDQVREVMLIWSSPEPRDEEPRDKKPGDEEPNDE